MFQLFGKKHTVNHNQDNFENIKKGDMATENLYRELDTIVNVSQARANLLRRISEMKEELGIDNDSQILIIEK